MSYAKEFNHLFYNVPEFLLTEAGWKDVSYRNDVAPRWENSELYIAIWVDCNEPELREYDDWAQYTVVQFVKQIDGSTMLCDEPLFTTEVQAHLEEWLALYETKMHTEMAFQYASHCFSEDGHDIADELAMLIAQIQEAMDNIHDNETPDCAPSGEPM